jgi:hypothetical protein
MTREKLMAHRVLYVGILRQLAADVAEASERVEKQPVDWTCPDDWRGLVALGRAIEAAATAAREREFG